MWLELGFMNLITGRNLCLDNDCSHLCLLSSARDEGYTCACPIGMELADDGVSCGKFAARHVLCT